MARREPVPPTPPVPIPIPRARPPASRFFLSSSSSSSSSSNTSGSASPRDQGSPSSNARHRGYVSEPVVFDMDLSENSSNESSPHWLPQSPRTFLSRTHAQNHQASTANDRRCRHCRTLINQRSIGQSSSDELCGQCRAVAQNRVYSLSPSTPERLQHRGTANGFGSDRGRASIDYPNGIARTVPRADTSTSRYDSFYVGSPRPDHRLHDLMHARRREQQTTHRGSPTAFTMNTMQQPATPRNEQGSRSPSSHLYRRR